jgi:hypothetical protein
MDDEILSLGGASQLKGTNSITWLDLESFEGPLPRFLPRGTKFLRGGRYLRTTSPSRKVEPHYRATSTG